MRKIEKEVVNWAMGTIERCRKDMIDLTDNDTKIHELGNLAAAATKLAGITLDRERVEVDARIMTDALVGKIQITPPDQETPPGREELLQGNEEEPEPEKEAAGEKPFADTGIDANA